MIFNSVTYILFLLFIVILYWGLPKIPRLLLIFLSSLTFYGFWRIEFVPVMLVSVVVDYYAALGIDRAKSYKIKKRWLLLSLFTNLGLLFYFKYLLFFAENAIGLMHLMNMDAGPILLNIILPLGISFYTFQTISYTVDVYRGFIRPERNFILYGCYVTFFPQLIAGPILRAAEVIPQFSKRPSFDWGDIGTGLRRIFYGLFLKVVLADNISPLVDAGYATPINMLSALDVWTLAFLFGFQIYFDFSAYSHIAIGSARLMGICFPENFHFPYLAISPKDFWRRWHISLSSWIRDYLYLPLVGVKVHDKSVGGLATATTGHKKNKALFITWAIMGLWHGASWTFVIWGIYHAIFIFIYRLSSPLLQNISQQIRVIGGLIITLPIVMLSWIPFRAQTVSDTFAMYSTIIKPSEYLWLGLRENTYLIAAILLLGIFSTFLIKMKLMPILNQRTTITLISETMVFSIIIGLVFVFLRPINQFIYFQF